MSRYSSQIERSGDYASPDILYYNASIVNNNTDDLINGFAFNDPLIKFNETRDQPIIRDASQYQFSIVRFVVNGGNLDLPLFIPSIQSSTGQFDPNLTEYGFGISLSIQLTNADASITTYRVCPPLTYVEFEPENLNPFQAPLPLPPCSPDFVYIVNGGIWDNVNAYSAGNIVTVPAGGLPGVAEPYIRYVQASKDVPAGTALNATYVVPATGQTVPYWKVVSPELGRPQDISSRYYWVSTFQHWVDLVNVAFDNANQAVYNGLLAGWVAHGGSNNASNFPYPAYSNFVALGFAPPIMNYNAQTGLFNISYPDVYVGTSPKITIGLWMNINSYGLFANFPSKYYNKPAGDGSLGATLSGAIGPFLPGYAYRMTVEALDLGSNVFPIANIKPVPPPTDAINYYRMYQEYISTSTLWSPVDSIVFVSNLLPIQNEQTAPPNVFGSGNVGNSTATVPSAFQPIITDVANSLSADPTGWRKMLYYAPTAEYRMADFQNSRADIKNIDVQVFWKNRLNNELYPLTMYNLSSVSIKIMFRKKSSAY